MQKAIDSHFHIWRQQDLPWLVGPMVPRIFGPYEPIRRDYPIEEFLGRLRQGAGVEKAVYVQTNWAKEDFEKEVAWVQKTADETGWPHAIVGYADMTVGRRPAAARPAEEISAAARRAHAAALARDAGIPLRRLGRPGHRSRRCARNVARLKDYGLSFDLQLFPAQMKDGLTSSARTRETNFILTHAGMLTDIEPETTEAWKAGLRTLSAAPNFYAKLSGLGTFVHRNDPALIALHRRQRDRHPRQRPSDVRLELPDREAVDQPCRADQGAPRGRGASMARRLRRISSGTRRRRFTGRCSGRRICLQRPAQNLDHMLFAPMLIGPAVRTSSKPRPCQKRSACSFSVSTPSSTRLTLLRFQPAEKVVAKARPTLVREGPCRSSTRRSTSTPLADNRGRRTANRQTRHRLLSIRTRICRLPSDWAESSRILSFALSAVGSSPALQQDVVRASLIQPHQPWRVVSNQPFNLVAGERNWKSGRLVHEILALEERRLTSPRTADRPGSAWP